MTGTSASRLLPLRKRDRRSTPVLRWPRSRALKYSTGVRREYDQRASTPGQCGERPRVYAIKDLPV
eukprot:6173445-Pleurochrysis_carterae.AAC.4